MYFKIPNEVSIDPLFEVDKFKAEDTSQILKNLDFLRSLKYSNKLNREMKKLFNIVIFITSNLIVKIF